MQEDDGRVPSHGYTSSNAIDDLTGCLGCLAMIIATAITGLIVSGLVWAAASVLKAMP